MESCLLWEENGFNVDSILVNLAKLKGVQQTGIAPAAAGVCESLTRQ